MCFSAKSARATKWGKVAVHAEERIGDDQAAAKTGVLAEQIGEMIGVAVAIDERVGARQAAAVDQAGVVLLVGEDRVAAIGERGDRARVGGEAGGEQKRGLGSLELGQAFFEPCVPGGAAGDEGTCAGAPAVFVDGTACGVCEPQVGGETEVVVGAEVDERFSGDIDDRPLRGVPGEQPAAEAGGFEFRKLVVEPVESCFHALGSLRRRRAGANRPD